jgi:cyclophilin family peptidyl-prolyl cis-trans isomerase/protein-disulfide isomerase
LSRRATWTASRDQARARTLGILLLASLAACQPGQRSQQIPPTRPAARTPIVLGPTSTLGPETATPPQPTPMPTSKPLPAPSESDWRLGPAQAAVTIVEYTDFTCGICSALAPVLEDLQHRHASQLRLIVRLFPSPATHDKSMLAAQAAFAADRQGAFWPMHDLLFERYTEWSSMPLQDFQTYLIHAADQLGLDAAAFKSALLSPDIQSAAQRARAIGVDGGLPGTPYLFLNGEVYRLGLNVGDLEASVRLAMTESRQFAAYPAMNLDLTKTYLAHLHFNIGEVIIRLYPDAAPLGVNSFIFLANQGWYDDNPVYGVIPGDLIECGDPSGTGIGQPGYSFPTETVPGVTFDDKGMVALSASGPDANGGSFFITLRPMPELNGSRTIIGHVVQGLDLLAGLSARDPFADLLAQPEATLLAVTIEIQ